MSMIRNNSQRARPPAGGRNPSGKHGMLEVWNGHTGHHEGHSTRHLRHDLAGHLPGFQP